MKEQLIHIKDRIYGEVHKYYNTRTRMTDAFLSVGLPDSPSQGELNQLDTASIRVVKPAILYVVIDAIKLGIIDDEVKTLGYASIQEAHDDAPNHITDLVELKEVQTNMAEFIAVLDCLAPMTDKALVMTQILGAKGVVNILEEVDGEGVRRIDKLNRSIGILIT